MKALLALLMLIVPIAGSMAQDESPGVEESAALAWLDLVDSGRFQESWDAASALFRRQLAADDWGRLVAGVRVPLGALQSRRLQGSTAAVTLPGAPDGDYMILQFASSFDNKERAQERVTLMREGTEWRVAGYYIR